MTWLSWHSQSEQLASAAEVAARGQDKQLAEQLYSEAARTEAMALKALDPSKTRTLGITAVSAVALWLKAGKLREAERLAHSSLNLDLMPEFAVAQLRQLIQTVWTAEAMAAADVSFLPGQVLVSIQGGSTVPGGAPLDLIVDKVQTVQALFYRTIELLKGLPLRVHGGPSFAIQDACQPWLFQAPAGSYQFSVAIQKPRQQDFFETTDPSQVAQQFIAILKASSSEAPAEQLHKVVKDDSYRPTFLKLTRNLAPTGKSFSRIEIRSADETRGVVLAPENRTRINDALRAPSATTSKQSPDRNVEIRGVLRAVHLDKDWLELTTDGNRVQIFGLSDAVDDVIGPIVNRRAVVQATKSRGKRLKFVDIEAEE